MMGRRERERERETENKNETGNEKETENRKATEIAFKDKRSEQTRVASNV